MKMILIATATTNSATRMAGSYQAAWRVTIGNKTGLVVHSFDFDKRDIENETVVAEKSIADAMRDELNDFRDGDWWDPAAYGFYDNGQRIDNTEAMEQAIEAVTEVLYEDQ